MKKAITVALAMAACVHSPAQAHKEWVHQYMVKEAYLFLRNLIGPVPVLEGSVGLNYHGIGTENVVFDTRFPQVGVGAWREDNEDLVYGLGTSAGNGVTPSITHFWKADRGDNARSLQYSIDPNSTVPNAWEKARAYLFSQDRDGHASRVLQRILFPRSNYGP
ncbi:hypothetical protein GCM10027594_01550 [Hymenobacter agri]